MVQIWEAKSIEKSLLGRLKRFKPVGGVGELRGECGWFFVI